MFEKKAGKTRLEENIWGRCSFTLSKIGFGKVLCKGGSVIL